MRAGFSVVRWASVVLLVSWMAPDAHAGSVLTFLSQDGRDVSATIDARVVFSPSPGTDGAPIECAPAEACAIPLGQFTIGLRSPTHVLLDRPKYISDTAPDIPTKPLVLRVTAAAFVELGRGRFPQGKILTVLDIESGLNFKRPIGRELTSVQVPARRVVAAAFRDLAIVELWRPVTLKAGQHLELPENPPLARGRGQLVVSLLFPASGVSGGNRDVAVHWKSERGSLPPDLTVTSDPWRWIGFWFDLPSGEGTIEVDSKSWALAQTAKVPVPDRGVGFADELKLIPRPRLKARFEENGRLPAGEAEVDLLDCRRLKLQSGPPHYSLCTEVSSLKRGVDEEFFFEGLDPVLHALRWKAGKFRGFHMVNLDDGQSKDVTIPVAIHLVKGSVTRKKRPVPESTLTWRHFITGIESPAVTGEEGRYEVLLAPSGQYTVFLDGPGFTRHLETLDVQEDREADFAIPANRTEVRVVDAESGEPVPAAQVSWSLEAVNAILKNRVEVFACDETGKVQLPPSPPGHVTVTARARGYRRSEEQRLEMTKDSSSADLEFRLVKGVETRIRLVDANGAPARGAWALLPSGGLTGPADDAGETYFESLVRPGDPVFAASATGAIVLARFVGEDAPIRIGAPSPPFTVRFLTADRRSAPQVHLSYAIDGIEVPQVMAFKARRAAGGDIYSRRDGSLIVAGLPTSGTVALWPTLKPDAVVTRPLPITEVLEFPAP